MEFFANIVNSLAIKNFYLSHNLIFASLTSSPLILYFEIPPKIGSYLIQLMFKATLDEIFSEQVKVGLSSFKKIGFICF